MRSPGLRSASRRLSRTLTVLFVLVSAAQVVVLPLVREQPECTEPCPGDGADGKCPPMCQFGACCSPVRALAPAAALSVPTGAPVRNIPARTVEAVPSPEPHEIFHVPKPAGA